MAEILDPKTRDTLRIYLRDTRSLPNEAAKRQRFSALIAELFRGTRAITEFARGVEKLIRINRPTGEKRGHADAYYGNAIIEFENSLSATLNEADHQLCEYVSGSWRQGVKPLLAIASDGINWRIYRPRAKVDSHVKILPEDVELDLLRPFKLTDETLGDFWLWITSLLFRPQQVEPTPHRFQIDFGAWSPLYRDGMIELQKAWTRVADQSEARLAFETWQKYLTVTYGKLAESAARERDRESGLELSELEKTFLQHTYLASIARLLIWASLSQGKTRESLRDVARSVFSGFYFKSQHLANLVEDDFFHWLRQEDAERILAGFWERVLAHFQDYDLSRLNQDVLKGVYQQLIDPKDRHDLGEYYTPDWLCERIVSELLPKQGYAAVLDPSCGSGSFLRAAIAHFISHNPAGSDLERLKNVTSGVRGIDIHPVAVTISRATYVLALGSLIKAARKPIQIPVYLADSLFLPHEVEQDLANRVSGIEIALGRGKHERWIVMPQDLVHSPELFDDTVAACATVAEDHAHTGTESSVTLERHLAQAAPGLKHMLGHDQILEALWKFTEGLAALIRDKENSIWSFIVRNSYRPAMLREQFDFIIGNPPWLSYRYIADPDYQAEVKRRAVNEYAIAPKSQKLFTQMELATVFLAHCMKVFARPGAKLGFVMPRGILSADQHQKLIRCEYNSPFRITGYWDLWDVFPLFNVPAAVLFAQRGLKGGRKDVLEAQTWSGKLPERNAPWSTAREKLRMKPGKARVIYLGQRCAWSTSPGLTSPQKSSHYQKTFKDGATIYPRNFYFVRIPDLEGVADTDRLYWAETDPEQAAHAKRPYRDVRMEGLVEGKFIFSSALSKHILPFVAVPPATVVLPIETQDGAIHIHTSESLRQQGYREFARWMQKAESIWEQKRGVKSARHTAIEWLDYQGKLTRQNLHASHLVLYNASGTNVSAAYLDRESLPAPFVVDHKLYYAALADQMEADFLTALLNSKVANDAIKPFQSSGLLGERDIHKKLLDLPIPTFNPDNQAHPQLAELGGRARQEAVRAIKAPDFPARSSLARQRAFIRKKLANTLGEIDKTVRKMLGSALGSELHGL
ncbi:MAG TPA: N-6 DNA methylase [Terriglobia bacterium]|nr:N-6 DNA methylase [Terriglobia bacterium]